VGQYCPIECDIFVEVVELFAAGITLEGFSRNTIRKDDIMVVKPDVQILAGVRGAAGRVLYELDVPISGIQLSDWLHRKNYI